MILQTGQRTDIPAFYGEWFINRIKEGFVDVRNPYHPKMVTRHKIAPHIVDGIAFCSKNPRPFMKYLPAISDYRQYWHVTITPYGDDIEPYVPSKTIVLEAFRELSNILNSTAIVWRYDPIILTHRYTYDFHCESFHQMAQTLSGYTDRVVVSFLDIFDKVLQNFPGGHRPEKDIQHKLIGEFVQIAKSCHMTLKTCGEGHEFNIDGAHTEGCLLLSDYERAWGVKLEAPKRNPARPECACYLHGDIGAYDTCEHFCRYCYANTNQSTVRSNRALHNPQSTMLVGELQDTDILRISDDKSWIVPYQEELF
ncbi:DUF1848 domain-containing protein [Veillonella agrestimuris]|uniref:DUF1848 domain-containing protein n=1 Tax=Veillonella agrestimuris TaxID=2941340 RepID=UPI0020420CBB|nr:DUF1848 domain-containing protein [Veillonella agrestimuris]